MEIPPLLLQFVGSLVAILALYWLARALKLGRQSSLGDEESVRFAAEEAQDGFAATRVAISRGGGAALASNAQGQIMLIKRHGTQLAGRILSSQAQVHEEVDAIIVECGDARFGKVRLSLETPSVWVDAINRL